MKKFIVILVCMFALTGCSNVDKEAYNDLLSQHSENEKALEEITNQLGETKDMLELREETLTNVNKELSEAQAVLKSLQEENKLLMKDTDNAFYAEYYKKHFEPAFMSDEAKKIIEDRSQEAIRLLSENDFEGLSSIAHPIYGIRFTPYTFVDIERDLVFFKNEIMNFNNDDKLYVWGIYDGIGDNIELKPLDYFMDFVYDADFIKAEQVAYNEIISDTGWIENQFGIYHNSIIVEYYFSGFNPSFQGMDWASLRIVFQKYEDNWYITGVIHNEWTI